jgi:hypothetical protein
MQKFFAMVAVTAVRTITDTVAGGSRAVDGT